MSGPAIRWKRVRPPRVGPRAGPEDPLGQRSRWRRLSSSTMAVTPIPTAISGIAIPAPTTPTSSMTAPPSMRMTAIVSRVRSAAGVSPPSARGRQVPPHSHHPLSPVI